MSAPEESLVPAAGFHWLTPLYDPLVAFTCRDKAVKKRLVDSAGVQPGQRVLDLGCGTGNLTLGLKKAYPSADVVGFDADPRVIGRAAAKARRVGLSLRFEQGFAQSLPYPDGSFERVVSSLFFHHLSPAAKAAALGEAFRVLAPGGELHIADWGRPGGPIMRALFLGIRLLDGFANTAPHAAGRLPVLVQAAGFGGVRVVHRFGTAFGTLELISGDKPVEASA